MNFLEETKAIIKGHAHTIEDIIFIGDLEDNLSCTWDEFEKLADFDYYQGFGSNEVELDLIIAFKNGDVLKRGEYDGSEWWEMHSAFVMPKNTEKLTSLRED